MLIGCGFMIECLIHKKWLETALSYFLCIFFRTVFMLSYICIGIATNL